MQTRILIFQLETFINIYKKFKEINNVGNDDFIFTADKF